MKKEYQMLKEQGRLIDCTKEMSYDELAKEVKNLINRFEKQTGFFKTNWRDRYCGYASGIQKYGSSHEKKYDELHKLLKDINLDIYTVVSSACKAKNDFNIRFQGQSIGMIEEGDRDIFKFVVGDVKVINKKKYSVAQFQKDGMTLLDYYKIDEYINDKKDALKIELSDEKFKTLTSFFSNCEKVKRVYNKSIGEMSNREHEYESKILSANQDRIITLCGAKFQMPTPLGASKVVTDGIVKYSGPNGNGCDILMKSGKALSVIELKDEEDTLTDGSKKTKASKKETPEMSIKQAICYAVFLGTLLSYRDDDTDFNEKCAKPWREILGFEDIKEKLPINAVICMPYESEYKTDFDGTVINMGDFDITLRAVLFDKDDNTWKTAFDKLDV